MPASLSESIVQFQGQSRYGPADRQHFLTFAVHPRIAIKHLDFALVAHARPCVRASVLSFRLAASRQMR